MFYDVDFKVEKKPTPTTSKNVVCQICGKLVKEKSYETHVANNHG
jgi:hypothetical protein